MFSNIDVFIAFGIIVLSLYSLKRYWDARKRYDEAEASWKFPHAHIQRSFCREYKSRNRALSFFITPFFAAVVYIVLRLSGTIDNIFI